MTVRDHGARTRRVNEGGVWETKADEPSPGTDAVPE